MSQDHLPKRERQGKILRMVEAAIRESMQQGRQGSAIADKNAMLAEGARPPTGDARITEFAHRIGLKRAARDGHGMVAAGVARTDWHEDCAAAQTRLRVSCLFIVSFMVVHNSELWATEGCPQIQVVHNQSCREMTVAHKLGLRTARLG